MADSGEERNPVEELAEEFMERFRRGERPTLQEYRDRYPHLAADIDDLFPALVKMEQVRPRSEVGTGPFAGRVPLRVTGLERLGDFRILREIGRGGMGVVYEAEQESLGRRVALKVLPRHHLLDPRQVQRFQREARAAARLHHTNIVPVHGVGENDGLHYYVMQFINGLGLDQVLSELQKEGPPRAGGPVPLTAREPAGALTAAGMARSLLTGAFSPPQREDEQKAELSPENGFPFGAASSPEVSSSSVHLPGPAGSAAPLESGRQYFHSVARIGVQVAEALAYAHSQGILHRDIKPSNLLLDTRGNVWIADFGLAKTSTDTDNLTNTGDIVGTMRYMAPERFEGQADARSDLYALGLTLYELLARRPPFVEENRNALFQRILRDDPPPPRKFAPNLPPDLETVVLKAIARDPDHRYQTAADLAEDLKRFVEDRPIRARPVSYLEKSWRLCRRNPVPATLLGVLVLGFWVAFGLVSWQYWKAEGARRNESRQRQDADRARDEATRARDDAEKQLYLSNIARARFEWRANNLRGAEEVLARCPEKHRGWEWGYLKRLCHAELVTLSGHTGWACGVAWSPDNRFLASAGGGNAFFRNPGAVIRPGELILWDAATGERLRTFKGHTNMALGVAFSPDSRYLASGSYDQTVRVWDVATGREVRQLAAQVEGQRLRFSPDGRQLVVAGGDLKIWELAPGDSWEGNHVPRVRVVPGKATSVDMSSDGRWLAAAGAELEENNWIEPWVVNLETGQRGPGLQEVRKSKEVAFGPDGRLLVAAGSGGVRVWQWPDGRLLRTLVGNEGWSGPVAFSPDGSLVAAGGMDTTVRIWNVQNGEGLFVFRGHSHRVLSVAFSPDGMRLASAGVDATVKVWDLTREPELCPLQGPFGGNLHGTETLAFSPGPGPPLVVCNQEAAIQVADLELQNLHDALVPGVQPLLWLSPSETFCLDSQGRWLARLHPEDRRLASLWEVATSRHRVLAGHEVPLAHVTVSPGGLRVATAGYLRQKGEFVRGEVKVWDGETGRPLFEISEPGLRVSRLALSPDGRRLALAQVVVHPRNEEDFPGESLLRLFEVDTGREFLPATRHPEFLTGLAFNPPGTLLGAAGWFRQTVVVRDLATGQERVSHQGPPSACDLAFSPDRKRLAVAGRPLVKLLDLESETLDEVFLLRGIGQTTPNNLGFNPRVRFSPDGLLLAAVTDGSRLGVSVWSAAPVDGVEPARLLEAAVRRAVQTHWRIGMDLGPGDPRSLFHLNWLRRLPLSGPWEHLRRAQLLIRHGARDEAGADLVRAAELAPRDPVVQFACGDAYGQLGHWHQAADSLSRAVQLQPEAPVSAWTTRALLALQLNEREEFRHLCREAVGRDHRVISKPDASRLAFVCLLTPDAMADAEPARRLVERCLSGTDNAPQQGWFQAVKGMAECRAGHFDRARDWLQKAQRQEGTRPEDRVVAGLVLAMTCQLLGQNDRARGLLGEAVKLHKETPPPPRVEEEVVVSNWRDELLFQVVRREAEMLLAGSR